MLVVEEWVEKIVQKRVFEFGVFVEEVVVVE